MADTEVPTTTWGDLVRAEPDLALFGRTCLEARPSYLATLRADGTPRVHPVTPIVTDDGLFVFSEPASPKVHDLRERASFALHNGVPDNDGTGGEFLVSGRAVEVIDDPAARARVVAAARYEPNDRYLLFELRPTALRAGPVASAVSGCSRVTPLPRRAPRSPAERGTPHASTTPASVGRGTEPAGTGPGA
jgi:hypothetical protein